MGKRGPAKGTGGRPAKPLADKLTDGNPGKRPLTVLEFPKAEIAELEAPSPPAFLNEASRAEAPYLSANEIFDRTVKWLETTGCLGMIPMDYIEEYALCKTRWLECEAMNAKHGLLAKHPTTGQPMQSPYVQMALTYLKQADSAWSKLFEIVKASCTTDYKADDPNADVMERLLSLKGGKR